MMRTSSGKPMTPALVERAVRDAEHGFDLTTTHAIVNPAYIGPGRPRLKGSPGTSPKLTVRVPPALREQLRREARRRGIKLATLMRERLAAKA